MWILDIIVAGLLTVAVALLAEEVRGWYRKALWVLVVILVVGLAGVQIVERAGVEKENKRLESDRKTDADEQRKNLTTVISQMSNLTIAINQLQQRPPVTTIIRERPPQPSPTEEAKLLKMNNSEFRQYAMDWAKKLRDFETKFSTEDAARFLAMPRFGADQSARDIYMSTWSQEMVRRNQEHLNEYKNNFWSETVAIYNELDRRYKTTGKTLPEPGQVMPFATAVMGGDFLIKNTLGGNLNGPHPIGELADYIEILARQLPN